AGRISAQMIVSLPILRRPHRAGHKSAAAVGADVFQKLFHAILAEGALEGANHGFAGSRRQRLAAVFATWSELEHPIFMIDSQSGFPSKSRERNRGALSAGEVA